MKLLRPKQFRQKLIYDNERFKLNILKNIQKFIRKSTFSLYHCKNHHRQMESSKYPHNNTLTIICLVSLCIFALPVTASNQVPPLSEEILQKIFNNNQIIVVYVCQQQTPQTYEHFADYCIDHPCAFLDKTNPVYESIRNFVGHPHEEYFAILDAPRQLKYVLEVKDKTIKYKDIYNFQADFTSLKLTPFYSSEQQPTQVFEPCRKLVGKNFNEFLALKAPIKVVYLYTQQEGCSICGEMLRGFADIAQKIYRQDVIAFGYFDIFKNDHEKIPSEVAPFFLVFKEGQEEPYGIEGEKFPQLENALINIIAEQIYPGYKDGEAHEDEINPQDLVEQDMDDIQELQISEREQEVEANYDL